MIASETYLSSSQRIIHLRANDTAEFVFTNTKKPGLRLVKTSADGSPLDGVTFKITRIEDASHSIDRTTARASSLSRNGTAPPTNRSPGQSSASPRLRGAKWAWTV